MVGGIGGVAYLLMQREGAWSKSYNIQVAVTFGSAKVST